MRLLVYGVAQFPGENVEVDGDDYRVLTVESAPEAGYDGLNQWEGPGGTYTSRASWVTLEPLSAVESRLWTDQRQAAFEERIKKPDRPWWKLR